MGVYTYTRSALLEIGAGETTTLSAHLRWKIDYVILVSLLSWWKVHGCRAGHRRQRPITVITSVRHPRIEYFTLTYSLRLCLVYP